MIWLADTLFGPRGRREAHGIHRQHDWDRVHRQAVAARDEVAGVMLAAAGRGIRAALEEVAALGRRYRARRRREATIRELNALDDRILHDIGLTRDDVRAMAASPLAVDRNAALVPPRPAGDPEQTPGAGTVHAMPERSKVRAWRRVA